MKVVFLGTRGFPNVQGGVEKHCEYLTTNLTKLKVDVIVFTRKQYIDPKLKYYSGVRLIPIKVIKNKFLEAFFHTFIGIFAAKKYDPDILHIQAIGPSIFTPLARLFGFKVVVTSHGSNYKHLKWGRFAKLFLKISEYIGVKSANEIVAISNTIADDINKKYMRKPVVIPNGVQKPHFISTMDNVKRFGLNKERYILSVGRIVPEKGFNDLIDAFSDLHLDGWKLVIAGGADHESEYSKGLKKIANKNKNIVLTGLIIGKSLQELYSHAGLFVLPSYYEGLPIVLLEALSYALSCVVTDIDANRNVPLDKNRYFMPGDVTELKQKIREYVKKPLSKIEKERQVNLINKNYNWGKIAGSTLDVYTRILEHV